MGRRLGAGVLAVSLAAEPLEAAFVAAAVGFAALLAGGDDAVPPQPNSIPLANTANVLQCRIACPIMSLKEEIIVRMSLKARPIFNATVIGLQRMQINTRWTLLRIV